MKIVYVFSLIFFLTFYLVSCTDGPEIKQRKISSISFDVANHEHKNKLNILVFGDSGTGKQPQQKVAKSMYKDCVKTKCDFALVLGDNVYNDGVKDVNDPLFKKVFEIPYRDFNKFGRFDFWIVLGNHDSRGNSQAQVDYSVESNLWRMPSFDYEVPNLPKWINIYALDTTLILDDNINPLDYYKAKISWRKQISRAKEALCDKPGWKMIFTHHPMHSSGKQSNWFKEEKLEKELKGLMKKCKVDFHLAGHEHYLEHIKSRSYDTVISGSAAKLIKKKQKKVRGVGNKSKFKKLTLGYNRFEVSPKKITVKYFDQDGDFLYEFTRIK